MSDQLAVTVLVVAKAPVPGLAKTRLAATVGIDAAADIAAAALLDTLDAVANAPVAARVVAMTGDLAAAKRSAEIRRRLADFIVIDQRGEDFGDRLANAHADAAAAGAGRPVVQIGMDTPQVDAVLLREVADLLDGHDAVLGEAEDGGWWVLALRDPAAAAGLAGVPMSTPTTYADTLAALVAAGLDVATTTLLRDVDTVGDADLVAAEAPGTAFAAAWRELAVRR